MASIKREWFNLPEMRSRLKIDRFEWNASPDFGDETLRANDFDGSRNGYRFEGRAITEKFGFETAQL
jgi:hypothetical protein